MGQFLSYLYIEINIGKNSIILNGPHQMSKFHISAQILFVVFWTNSHSWKFVYMTAGRDSREKFQAWNCVKRKRKAVVSLINVLCLAKLGIYIFLESN